MSQTNKIKIYKTSNGKIQLSIDLEKETVWLNLKQIANLFDRDKSVISRHIKNIFKDKELSQKQTVAIFATIQKEWKKKVKRNIEYYNLDMIISIGYRVDSKQATQFRIRATNILKDYLTKGYTFNQKRLEENYHNFLQAVDNIKALTQWKWIQAEEVIDLIKSFGNTRFNLENYDKDNLPHNGITSQILKIQAQELYNNIQILKKDLISQNIASELFAQEKTKSSLEWIIWNIFQTAFQKEVYPTIEEKAAHLLYFIIKDHPFTDGNKRTGAFSFVRFLKKAKINFESKITPEALTTLTLLIAQSDPKDKSRIIGLILSLL